MKKRCRHSGKEYDYSFVDWQYPNGYPTEICPDCGAKRKLIKVVRSLGRRGSGCYRDALIYPYHYHKT
jgi:hypothetical protein